MIYKPQSISNFVIPLGTDAHAHAKQFAAEQFDSSRGKKGYLNTLATHALAKYLNLFNVETTLDQSYSLDPRIRNMLNIADLKISGAGIVECCPVLPGEDSFSIPLEFANQRIGFVAVMFQEDLSFVRLGGFISAQKAIEITMESDRVPLNKLEPLENLMDYLPDSVFATNLVEDVEAENTPPSRSLGQRIASGLRQLGENLWPQAPISDSSDTPSMAYITANASVSPAESTKYDRKIDLGESGTVLLSVHVNDECGGRSKVLVELKSLTDQRLPPQLALSIIGESDSRQRGTRENQRILELNPYIKQPEDNPLIQVVLGDMICSFKLDELLGEESDVTA
jgi:Protein of unknown function (DUF1822)